jgi:hypothetical protein
MASSEGCDAYAHSFISVALGVIQWNKLKSPKETQTCPGLLDEINLKKERHILAHKFRGFSPSW